MDVITTIGLDIAKNVFQLHGVDGQGQVVLRRALRRAQMTAFFAKLPVDFRYSLQARSVADV